MLLEINNTENVPEYSEKQKKQYNDAIKAYDHTGNGVSCLLYTSRICEPGLGEGRSHRSI